MTRRLQLLVRAFVSVILTVGIALASDVGSDDSKYCMGLEIGPFHMVPGYTTEYGACAVRDYWGGWLQDKFYPFTVEDHLFNCEVYGETMFIPFDFCFSIRSAPPMMPTSVVSEGEINGNIDGHPFAAKLFCASLANWYQGFCEDPCDSSCFQLAQPLYDFAEEQIYPRVTEVSIFDGVINVERNDHKTVEIPIMMVTRAAGILHLKSWPDPPQVRASVTHSLLGMVTYREDGNARVLDGNLDLLLQGHIFFPDVVENDPEPAVIKGNICSRDLYMLLNKKGAEPADGDDSD